MVTQHPVSHEGLLAALAERQVPLAASTVDGQVRDAATPLSDRLAAVRSQAPVANQGSCPFTGWES